MAAPWGRSPPAPSLPASWAVPQSSLSPPGAGGAATSRCVLRARGCVLAPSKPKQSWASTAAAGLQAQQGWKGQGCRTPAAGRSCSQHCQPDLTPCPGSQLRPLFLLALADFLAAAVLLGTATIQLLPAPLFIPAYAACPYGLMLATVSGAAHTMTGVNGTSAPPPVLLGTEQDPSVGNPSGGWSIPGEVPCGEALLLPRAVSSSPLSVLSHHDGFLGEAQPAALGRSALQPLHFPLIIPMPFLQPGVANPAQPCLVGTHGDRTRRGSAPWGQL